MSWVGQAGSNTNRQIELYLSTNQDLKTHWLEINDLVEDRETNASIVGSIHEKLLSFKRPLFFFGPLSQLGSDLFNKVPKLISGGRTIFHISN